LLGVFSERVIMIISVHTGYGKKFKKMGTVSIVDGKLKFDIPNENVLKILKGYPEDDPKAFMDNLIARFMFSSTVILKEELE